MKTGYEKELNKVSLHIDLAHIYEEDYKIHMLQENDIPGLLEIMGCGIDGNSRYSYTVTGKASMKAKFKDTPIRQTDMLQFVNRLMEVVKSLRRYMLSPDGLLLYPEFMFYGDGTWHFCYLPIRKKPLCEAFHVITEYFVKKLDYEDTEGIMLAYEIHKATLQDNYDLEKIMEEYEAHEEKRRVGSSRGMMSEMGMTAETAGRMQAEAEGREGADTEGRERTDTGGRKKGEAIGKIRGEAVMRMRREAADRLWGDSAEKRGKEAAGGLWGDSAGRVRSDIGGRMIAETAGRITAEKADVDQGLLFPLEEEYVQTPDVQTIREMGVRWNPWKKTADKLKKSRWGNWKDLILETDGHREEEPL